LKNNNILKFDTLYKEINSESVQILIPHIIEYFNFKHSEEEIFRFYNTLTDSWYARLDFSNFSVESMILLAEEIMGNVLKVNNK
jgi:hypothetical protein